MKKIKRLEEKENWKYRIGFLKKPQFNYEILLFKDAK